MKGIWIILKQVASLGCGGQEVGRSRGHQVMRCGAPVHGGGIKDKFEWWQLLPSPILLNYVLTHT